MLGFRLIHVSEKDACLFIYSRDVRHLTAIIMSLYIFFADMDRLINLERDLSTTSLMDLSLSLIRPVTSLAAQRQDTLLTHAPSLTSLGSLSSLKNMLSSVSSMSSLISGIHSPPTPNLNCEECAWFKNTSIPGLVHTCSNASQTEEPGAKNIFNDVQPDIVPEMEVDDASVKIRHTEEAMDTEACPAEQTVDAGNFLPGPAPVEVLISFDTTGSMSVILDFVKNNIREMLTRLFSDIPNLKVALLAHGDYCDGREFYLTKSLDLTGNLDALVDFLKNTDGTGGGDYEECYELILRGAQKRFSWSTGTQKALVMIGDAVPHSKDDPANLSGLDWREEADKLYQELVSTPLYDKTLLNCYVAGTGILRHTRPIPYPRIPRLLC